MTASATIEALTAALAAERAARQQAEARASSAEAMVAHYKLVIAKLRASRLHELLPWHWKTLNGQPLPLDAQSAAVLGGCLGKSGRTLVDLDQGAADLV